MVLRRATFGVYRSGGKSSIERAEATETFASSSLSGMKRVGPVNSAIVQVDFTTGRRGSASMETFDHQSGAAEPDSLAHSIEHSMRVLYNTGVTTYAFYGSRSQMEHIVQVGYNMSFGSNGDTRLFGIGGPSTTGAILTRDRIR